MEEEYKLRQHRLSDLVDKYQKEVRVLDIRQLLDLYSKCILHKNATNITDEKFLEIVEEIKQKGL